MPANQGIISSVNRNVNLGLIVSATGTSQTAKELSGLTKTISGMGKAIGTIEKGVSGATSLIAKFVSTVTAGFSIKGVILTVHDLDKSLLRLSASFNKWGIGLGDTEKAIIRVRDNLKMTKAETLELFKVYEKAFPMVSLEEAEKLFNNIYRSVGGNIEALQEMTQLFGGISQQFPDIQSAMSNLNLSDAKAVELMRIRLGGLRSMKAISREQLQLATEYLTANTQMTEEERKRAAEINKQIDAVNMLKQIYERINELIGRQLIPLFVDATAYIEKMVTWVESLQLGWQDVIDRIWGAVTALDTFNHYGVKKDKTPKEIREDSEQTQASIAGLQEKHMAGWEGRFGKEEAERMKQTLHSFDRLNVIRKNLQTRWEKQQGNKSKASEEFLMEDTEYRDTKKKWEDLTNQRRKAANLPEIHMPKPKSGRFSDDAEIARKAQEAKDADDAARKKKIDDSAAAENLAFEKQMLNVEATSKAFDSQVAALKSIAELSKETGFVGTLKVVDQISAIRKNYLAYEQSQSVVLNRAFKERATLEDDLKKKNLETSLELIAKNEQIAKIQKDRLEKLSEYVKLSVIELQVYKDLSEVQRALVEGESKLLDSVIARMQVTGKIDVNTLYTQMEVTFGRINEEVDSINKGLLAGRSALMATTEIQKELLTTYLRSKGIEEEAAKKMVGDDTKRGRIIQEIMSGMLELESRLNEKIVQRSEIANRLVSVYDKEKELVEAQVGIQSQLVSLMDQFAIGVGASAVMRKEVIDSIRDQLSIVDRQIAEQKRLLVITNNSIPVQIKLKSLQSERMSLLQKEAEMAKALRDGWVSAVNAMTVGSGRITKIAMTADKNLGLAVQNLKMVRTFYSGAIGRPGEGEVGQRMAEQFRQGPGSIATIANPMMKQPYNTDVGIPLQNLEQEIRGSGIAEYLGMAISEAVERSMGGNALGAGNPMALNAYRQVAREQSFSRGGGYSRGGGGYRGGRVNTPNIPQVGGIQERPVNARIVTDNDVEVARKKYYAAQEKFMATKYDDKEYNKILDESKKFYKELIELRDINEKQVASATPAVPPAAVAPPAAAQSSSRVVTSDMAKQNEVARVTVNGIIGRIEQEQEKANRLEKELKVIQDGISAGKKMTEASIDELGELYLQYMRDAVGRDEEIVKYEVKNMDKEKGWADKLRQKGRDIRGYSKQEDLAYIKERGKEREIQESQNKIKGLEVSQQRIQEAKSGAWKTKEVIPALSAEEISVANKKIAEAKEKAEISMETRNKAWDFYVKERDIADIARHKAKISGNEDDISRSKTADDRYRNAEWEIKEAQRREYTDIGPSYDTAMRIEQTIKGAKNEINNAEAAYVKALNEYKKEVAAGDKDTSRTLGNVQTAFQRKTAAQASSLVSSTDVREFIKADLAKAAEEKSAPVIPPAAQNTDQPSSIIKPYSFNDIRKAADAEELRSTKFRADYFSKNSPIPIKRPIPPNLEKTDISSLSRSPASGMAINVTVDLKNFNATWKKAGDQLASRIGLA